MSKQTLKKSIRLTILNRSLQRERMMMKTIIQMIFWILKKEEVTMDLSSQKFIILNKKKKNLNNQIAWCNMTKTNY